ncbi:hypothetical protein M0534_04990 [Methylonatrum kenyense]|uniref:hypothetical protein n=1 Tax=Methylonatrum kenyense TaxID=455253 RepID=UPI0020C04419|nr:hypothetical protein [Methylonatrum kenyense]MCK8515682.1 hypothetical protein [Methylonatrum kenyense]
MPGQYTVPARAAANLRLLPVAMALVGLAACAGTVTAPEFTDQDKRVQACQAYFQQIDAAVSDAGVRDGVGAPVDGYPWFRSSRRIAHLAPGLEGESLAAALRQHDLRARLLELGNLDATRRARLAAASGVDDLESKTDRCGSILAAASLAHDPELAELRDRLAVRDDYIGWHRWAGLYPVSRWGIRAGVAVWQRGTRAEFSTRPPAEAQPLRYAPAWPGESLTPEAAAQRVRNAPRDALGDLLLGESERDAIVAAFAPVIELERDVAHNRIGTPVWTGEGRPNVNTAQPRVFHAMDSVRFGGQVLPRIYYVYWFNSRPKSNPLDILGGRLDGMILRLTLAEDGRPLLLESLHNCGCYHQYYPLQALQEHARATYAEPPLVLSGPGLPGERQRLTVVLRDRSHHLRRLYLGVAGQESSGSGTQQYLLADYDSLRSVYGDGQERRSLFDADGLVPGTRRDEQVLFWVSGVPAPGAMRQLGRHPTAFVGRRHFDDPDLLDRVFVPHGGPDADEE